MDLSHIQEHYKELLSYMEQEGYSDTYIIRFRKEIQRILSKADNNDWASYLDIYNDYEKVPHSKDYLRNKRTIIGALAQFDLNGLFPDGRRRHSLFERGSYHLLSPEFRQFIDFYTNAERERGKKDSTIYSEARNTASFLHHLQDRGYAFLHDVSEEDVLSFFVTVDGRRIRSCSYRKNISAVFRSGLKWQGKECRIILSFLPMLRENRQNIQYLTETEVIIIRETTANGTLSYRNTAIICLLLYTGLRACDISGLMTDSIDWEGETVTICQQKTEVPPELPLSPIVGNAIFDYLQLERPDSKDPHLFLSEVKHYTPLKSGSISNIVSKCLLTSSIRQNAGDSNPNAELIQKMSDSWCQQRENEENNSCRSRIYVVVSFIKFLHDRGHTNVTPPMLPRREKRTYIPHSFTKEELAAFFQECDRITVRKNNPQDACRKLTIPVFFRLLYSSGIRTNEARILKREEIDLFHGVINIRYSKGHNQHYIVLHNTMLPLMKKYDEEISLLVPDRVWFFPSRDGSYYKKGWVTKTFNQIWRKVNKSHAVSYEFRHNYAVENINKWISEGFDFDDKLLYLSKSMGHTTIESTKYYYSIVPGLSDILKNQTEEGFDWIIPEVYDDEEE